MVGMVGRVNEETGENAVRLPSWHHLVGAKHSLRQQAGTGSVPPEDSPGHEDSWGVGWYDTDGRVSLLRQTGSAQDSGFYVFASEAASRGGAGSGPASVVLGHLRKASCGAVSSENAHPVRADFGDINGFIGARPSLLVAHNGTLQTPLVGLLRSDLADANRDEARSDSDTVVLAGWLALQTAQTRPSGADVASPDELLQTMGRALRGLFAYAEEAGQGDLTRAYTAVNLLIAHPHGLLALRQFSKNGNYYNLFARPLALNEGGGFVVSSEPTDEEPGWESLIPGELTLFRVRENQQSARDFLRVAP
jgi:predicted glutamine amidotransferase